MFVPAVTRLDAQTPIGSEKTPRGNLNTVELEMLVEEANARQAKYKKRSPHTGREVQWLENK